MLEFILERANYWAIIGLMMIGLYIAFSAENLIKRLVGVSLFQTSICLFYVTLGVVAGGTAPVLMGPDAGGHGGGNHGGDVAADSLIAGGTERFAELVATYSNPLPHVLMLTAIVVGVATLSLGLALIVRIREAYGTIEADDVRQMDIDADRAEAASSERELNEAGV